MYDKSLYQRNHYELEKLNKIRRENTSHAKKEMKGLKADIRNAESLGMSYGEYMLRKKEGNI